MLTLLEKGNEGAEHEALECYIYVRPKFVYSAALRRRHCWRDFVGVYWKRVVRSHGNDVILAISISLASTPN